MLAQTVAFVFCNATGYERYTGHLAVVTAPRVYGEWNCGDPKSSRPDAVCKEWRYTVRCDHRLSWHVAEYSLREIYDGEKLSTWEKFKKRTGVDIRGELVTVKRAGRRKSEPQHG